MNNLNKLLFIGFFLSLPGVLVLGQSINNSLVSADAAGSFYVRDYGAEGDGQTNDRATIQAAIDAAANAGGGEVILDQSRTYKTGNLLLKSNVTLVIESGARLKASSNFNDWDPPLKCRTGNADIIQIAKANNVGISGGGNIEGTSSFECELEGCCEGCRVGPGGIGIYDSSNINISQIKITNSAAATIVMNSCDHVTINGVTIDNITHDSLPSAQCDDGIDILNSQYVTVKNCDIYTNEDAIAIKGAEAGWSLGGDLVGGVKKSETETAHDILIENNRVRTFENGLGLEIGYEVNTEIYNVWWRNNTIQPPEGEFNYDYDVDITVPAPGSWSSRTIQGVSQVHNIYYENNTHVDGSLAKFHISSPPSDDYCVYYDIYWNGNHVGPSGDNKYSFVLTAEECGGGSNCSCVSWQNQGCGQGGCATDEMYQTRSCTPSNCSSQSHCINDTQCTPSPPVCNDNGICDSGEDTQHCPDDCPAPAPPAVCNDNGICDSGEDTQHCPDDCPAPAPPADGRLTADFNCDNYVNIYDFGNLMSCWGSAYDPNHPYNCAGGALSALCGSPDLTGDNKVDVNDLGVLLSGWQAESDNIEQLN